MARRIGFNDTPSGRTGAASGRPTSGRFGAASGRRATSPKRNADARTGSWARHLLPGERILWEGRPGFRFRPDVRALKLSLPVVAVLYSFYIVAGTMSVGGMHSLTSANGTVEIPFDSVQNPSLPALTGLLGLPDLGLSLSDDWILGAILGYLVLYNLWFALTIPSLTRYALTDRRALIARTLPFPWVSKYTLTPLTPVHHDGRDPGTVTFAEDMVDYGRGMVFRRDIGFTNIPDAARVAALMRRVQAGDA